MWVIFLTSDCKKEERIPLFKNLRVEDYITAPLGLLHWIVLLVFVVWLEFSSTNPRFGREWVTLQLEALGGLSATIDGWSDGGNATGSGVAYDGAYDDVTLDEVVDAVLVDPGARSLLYCTIVCFSTL